MKRSRWFACWVVPFAGLVGCEASNNIVEMRDEWNTNYFLNPTYNTKAVEIATEFGHNRLGDGVVVLAEGSTFKVRGRDLAAAACWEADHRVIVLRSDHADWPYTIINTDHPDGQSIRVRPG